VYVGLVEKISAVSLIRAGDAAIPPGRMCDRAFFIILQFINLISGKLCFFKRHNNALEDSDIFINNRG